MRVLCVFAPITLLALSIGCSGTPAQGGSGGGGAGAGEPGTGGISGSGGVGGFGGTLASGGATSPDGSAGVGGTSAAGGMTGGRQGSGSGGKGGGGRTATGGTGPGGKGSGGATGGSGAGGIGSGGTRWTGGAGAAGTSGLDGGTETTVCKRGIAANTTPGAAFFPAVAWWYNWAAQGISNSGMEFVPMIWGSGSLTSAIPTGSKYLLTFNEPNFMAQSNLTAAQAASYWPTIQTKAAGLPIVGPGMNFCGPAAQCNGTDPYQYLTDFFAACTTCEVDYVAVHWYNCDLPSLKDYLEPGGSLAGFEQFGKPIWLTEFSCDTSASAAQQETFMRTAIPYLEGNPKVFRYSWFSADPIPNAKLMGSDGAPTALGQVYIGLAQNCR